MKRNVKADALLDDPDRQGIRTDMHTGEHALREEEHADEQALRSGATCCFHAQVDVHERETRTAVRGRASARKERRVEGAPAPGGSV